MEQISTGWGRMAPASMRGRERTAMLGDYEAGEIRFAGLGADGLSAESVAALLAASLTRWAEAHAGSRIQQLSVLPAWQMPGTSGVSSCGAMALIAYTEGTLEPIAAAQAVAAAVEEIHEAQTLESDLDAEDDLPSVS
jgi:hypothetical protein